MPLLVQPGQLLFPNDGLAQIEVESVCETAICSRVRVGGELRWPEGWNAPGLDLGSGAFTEQDRACLKGAAGLKREIISQFFVQRAADIDAVGQAAADLAYRSMGIAEIE